MNTLKLHTSRHQQVVTLQPHLYHTVTISSKLRNAKLFIFLLILNGISCMTIKPLHQSATTFPCECFDENYLNVSVIDKNIRRYNPEISSTMYLTSNFGSPTKSIKVYKYINNKQIERILLFHSADVFNYELMLDTLIIADSTSEIKKPIYDDASLIISNVQDLLFYVKVSQKEYDAIKNSNNLLFRIHEMTLEINPSCKNRLFF